MVDQGVKRKRPPTFQHFPEKRARVLKKQWIEKQKIKSQWKAQKRREGLLPVRTKEHQGEEEEEEEKLHSNSQNENSNAEAEAEPAEKQNQESTTRRIQQPRPNSRSIQKDFRTQDKGKQPERNTNTDEKSLRERTREAYSSSSLHTFKSDPLKRRRGDGGSHRGSRGGVGVGRGQPNMKLRMNVMLEKIKRDYT